MSSAARPALEFEELAANPSDAEEAVAWALECVLTPRGFAYAVHSREGHSMVAYENCPPGACPSGRELPRAPWVSRRTSRWWGNAMEHAVRNSAHMFTPVKKFKTKEDLRDSCRKLRRKVGGTKAELEERLKDVFRTNDRGYTRRSVAVAGSYSYLESGAHRIVPCMWSGAHSWSPMEETAQCVRMRSKRATVNRL